MSKSTTESLIKTKTDSSLDATQHIYETASRLQDALTLLIKYTDVLTNPESRKGDTENALRSIKKSIQPLISVAINAMNHAGQRLAPIPSVKTIYEKHEKKRKREEV